MRNLGKLVDRFYDLKNVVLFSYLWVALLIATLVGSFLLDFGSVFLSLIVLLLCVVLAVVILICKRKMKKLRVRLSDMYEEIHKKSVDIRTELQILRGEVNKNSTGIISISPHSKYGRPVVEAIDFLDSLSYGHSDFLPQFDADPFIHLPYFNPNGELKNDFMSLLDEVCELINRKATTSKDMRDKWKS